MIESDTRTIGWTASTIQSDDSEITTAEDRANADLIATAPEMLEVLTMAKKQCERLPDDAETECLVQAIDEVIAKVKGNEAATANRITPLAELVTACNETVGHLRCGLSCNAYGAREKMKQAKELLQRAVTKANGNAA